METVYVVPTVPVRDQRGRILGWVRTDILADGTSPSDMIFLRDGSACGQAEAAERIAADPALLYRTRAAAVQDGLQRLRTADASGLLSEPLLPPF